MTGIVSFGGYVPRLRLQRKAAAAANAWYAPNLVGAGKGERAMCNWDEDSITMAVEAARDCLPATDPISGRKHIDAVYFASTTAPFADRQNAGVIAAALSLSEEIASTDVGGSLRAATSALLAALNAVKAGAAKNALVVSSEKRKAKAASSQELSFGDGAAAVEIGSDKVIARLVGSSSYTVDFVDHFREAGEDYDYTWEERWIRDEGYSKIVPATVKRALEAAGVAAADIAHFIMPCPFAKLDATIAKACGIAADKVRDNLSSNVGDTGAAHPLVMLVHALEQAKPGDKILVTVFAQGCDVLIFEATSALADLPKRAGITGSIARRKEETNYMKFLAFNGLVELEKGMRAEQDKKTALTTQYRKRDMLFGLTGGKCSKCGTAQFPRSRMCVNPNCKAVDTQDPYCFAELPAKILSWSADFLTYSMDPPNHYGMITFAEGGRFLSDFTDVDRGSFDSGTEVKMVFRIKDVDDKRGYVRYFWKAVPQV
ncbi:MAG: hydroxymethylglutaryl-CoA synthase family protein [Alphaproteobacteria bacterium]|nr:hydroxymethylglutaryl-CoA synthase family protein [Alphaproteobacteria bacterium]